MHAKQAVCHLDIFLQPLCGFLKCVFVFFNYVLVFPLTGVLCLDRGSWGQGTASSQGPGSMVIAAPPPDLALDS